MTILFDLLGLATSFLVCVALLVFILLCSLIIVYLILEIFMN